ncbi:Gfo/Idh/MocA family oxidoreductase [Fodinibius sp.]|uniref:Gfo/Idh/MocA family protein n=1 Tax=Fodinibius sp. TaxID=1872440 RepID=UPI002ACD4A98|nr:Gfo/Idh/MocA family oxidoreductase [Fodinibius sp.]MDZ7660282.1 Gfo/Idh/MocA family oxidoreductase [Fodinibius sp.]
MDIVNWGILSTAKIGVEKVIPAIQQAENSTVKGIASRSKEKANTAAKKLEISNAYGSYGELLADQSIDAIYNPLPNHLHVPKTVEALEAGKHVLCEKPIALNRQEAQELIQKVNTYPNLKVMEAFMYRFHPQWKKTKSLVSDGEIGALKTVDSFFSYYNDDPDNIRNKPDMGGGGLMDIGCYCISLSRFLFDEEPNDISGYWKIDPKFKTDYLASGVIEFNSGTATFTCATQTVPHQQVTVIGTEGRIIIEIPFNAPPDQTTRIWLFKDNEKKEITFSVVNQYTQQAKAFSDAVIKDNPVPTPLTDAVNNMTAIDAFRESAKSLSN